MEPQTLIFIGMSGCGKGTQIRLVREYLERAQPTLPIFYLQTGQFFREFIKGDTQAARIAREVVDSGHRAPDFLAMYLWSDAFVKNLNGREHLIIDGSPRSVDEARNLDIAMKFFRREEPVVVHIKVSSEWAVQRLIERADKEGRADDTPEAIRRRVAWYEQDVLPAVEQYRRDRDYGFIEVDGERSIEDIHRDIMFELFGIDRDPA